MKLLNFLDNSYSSLMLEDSYTLTKEKIDFAQDNHKIVEDLENQSPYSRFTKVLSRQGNDIYLNVIDKKLYLAFLRLEKNNQYARK